jgi:hypothetical protein
MSISLIIPVYNYLDLLEKCLFSVYRQSVLPDEIILTDDGSDDDIICFFNSQKLKTDIPIILIRQEHQNFRLARARNNGIYVSKGEILVFLDQDIVIPKDYLKSIKANLTKGKFLSGYPIRLNKEQTEKLTFGLIEKNDWSTILTKEQREKIEKQYRKDYLSYMAFRYLHIGQHGAKLRGGISAIFKSDLELINGYDENYIGCGNEDDDLGRRLQALGRSGYNFVRSQIPLHLYHTHYHNQGERKNANYSERCKKKISHRNYKCQKGLNSGRNDLEILV